MQRVAPRPAKLAGLPIGRVLPYRQRRCVGPFVFLDHLGPHAFAAGEGLDVGPHPHIGLATLTYVFAGAILHRDGLGIEQELLPGDVNWMVAGRGLAHAERTPVRLRGGSQLHAVQAWMALDEEASAAAPSFLHVPAAEVDEQSWGALRLRLLAGRWGALQARAPARPGAFYAELDVSGPAEASLDHEGAEAGLYLAAGDVEVAGERHRAPLLLFFAPDEAAHLRFAGPASAIWFGGPPLRVPPVMWWNFVADSPERIAQAARDWEAGRFAPVLHEPPDARLALPEDRPHPIF